MLRTIRKYNLEVEVKAPVVVLVSS